MIRWKRPKDAYPHSEDGRFRIVPIFRSTVKPDGYWLEDTARKRKSGPGFVRHNCYTVRYAKQCAETILADELAARAKGTKR